MGTPEDIITIEEAAKILGVTTTMVHKFVEGNVLRPVPMKENNRLKRHFRLAEVAAYAEIRSKNLTLVEVAMMAERSYAMSCSNERRLTNLTHALGLDSQVLETSEEAVVSLVVKVGDAELVAAQTQPSELMEWARIFFAVNEGYLGLVASYTANEEPWAPFMHLAQALVDGVSAAELKTNKELEEAYNYLEAARRNLRHVSYFYVWERHGVRKADEAFSTKEDYASPILGLLYPH